MLYIYAMILTPVAALLFAAFVPVFAAPNYPYTSGSSQAGLHGSWTGETPGTDAPPGAYLKGNIIVLAPGTHFRSQLETTLNSAYSREGQDVEATVTEPVTANGQVAIPAGSKLSGEVYKVSHARDFDFGASGKIKVKFYAVTTPEGRKFPINASIDCKEFKSEAGAPGAGSRTLRYMGHGAGRGLKYGAAGGALYGLASTRAYSPIFVGSSSMFGRTLRMGAAGALAGTALGAGAGLITAGIKKGADIQMPVGTSLPVQLDEALTLEDMNTSLGMVKQPAFAEMPQQSLGNSMQSGMQQSYGGYGQRAMRSEPYGSYPQAMQQQSGSYTGGGGYGMQ